MYVAVLVLLFLARMWSVHGVHGFLESMRCTARWPVSPVAFRDSRAKFARAAFARVYAPQTAADLVDRSIDDWLAQQAKVARLLARVCAGGDALCIHFHALDAQMLAVAASARAAAQAPLADRAAALGRLAALQGNYLAAANVWVDELTAHFTAETKTATAHAAALGPRPSAPPPLW